MKDVTRSENHDEFKFNELRNMDESLSDAHPRIASARMGTSFAPDYDSYPTKFYIELVNDKVEWDDTLLLRQICSHNVDVRINSSDLIKCLSFKAGETPWLKNIAFFALEEFQENGFINWFQVAYKEKLDFYIRANADSSEDFDFTGKNKFLFGHQYDVMIKTSQYFIESIIDWGCRTNRISVYDRIKKRFVPAISIQGIGDGREYSYRGESIIYSRELFRYE